MQIITVSEKRREATVTPTKRNQPTSEACTFCGSTIRFVWTPLHTYNNDCIMRGILDKLHINLAKLIILDVKNVKLPFQPFPCRL